MTIASEISRLQTAKQGIIESIRNKGVVVPDNVSLSDTPPLIDAIHQASPSYDDIYYKISPVTGVNEVEEIDWRIIPSGYTRKKAIRGNVSRLDCGFSPMNKNFEISIDFEFFGGQQYEGIIGTPYYNENTNIVRIIKNSVSSLIINADSKPGSSMSIDGFNGRHIVSFGRRNGIRYGLRDFATYSLSNNINSQQAPQENLYMFGAVNPSDSVTSTIYRLYAKIEGITVCDLVPCIRNTDSVPGFYDFANNMFRTSEDGGVSLVAID